MKIEASSITETSDFRVIIYPASRPFNAKEAKIITETLFDFLPTWAAHGKPLSASFKILKNQFVIVSVDEDLESASGCSIDSLGQVFRELDAEFNLGFFDRMKASFVENDEVKTMKLQEFRAGVKSGEISKDIQVFDFSKDTYSKFLSDFLLPLEKSWAGIYMQ